MKRSCEVVAGVTGARAEEKGKHDHEEKGGEAVDALTFMPVMTVRG